MIDQKEWITLFRWTPQLGFPLWRFHPLKVVSWRSLINKSVSICGRWPVQEPALIWDLHFKSSGRRKRILDDFCGAVQQLTCLFRLNGDHNNGLQDGQNAASFFLQYKLSKVGVKSSLLMGLCCISASEFVLSVAHLSFHCRHLCPDTYLHHRAPSSSSFYRDPLFEHFPFPLLSPCLTSWH